jgi:hypothetical protein
MEVKETAACGIGTREFAIEFEKDELIPLYRIMLHAQKGTGFFDEDFLESLVSQMTYIIGTSVLDAASEQHQEMKIRWEDTGTFYTLFFNEMEAGKLIQIFDGARHPGKGFDKELNQKLLNEMMEMAPTELQNLGFIMR